jgi:hypothetical protein
MNRTTVISTLLQCDRLDLEAAQEVFRNAHEKRNAALADLEARFKKIAALIADGTINASAIDPAMLLVTLRDAAVAAADYAITKARNAVSMPRNYAGVELRKILAHRAVLTVQSPGAAGLDAFVEDQTRTILAILDEKLDADIDAARVRLEGMSDVELNARVQKMRAALAAYAS